MFLFLADSRSTSFQGLLDCDPRDGTLPEYFENEYLDNPDRNYRAEFSHAATPWDAFPSEIGADTISQYDIALLEQTQLPLQQAEDSEAHTDTCLCRYCRFFLAYQEWELEDGASVPIGSETEQMLIELRTTILTRMRTFTPENVETENDMSSLRFHMMSLDEKAEFVGRSMTRLRRLDDFQANGFGLFGDDGGSDEVEGVWPLTLEETCLDGIF